LCHDELCWFLLSLKESGVLVAVKARCRLPVLWCNVSLLSEITFVPSVCALGVRQRKLRRKFP
jgi:hypothetical protein